MSDPLTPDSPEVKAASRRLLEARAAAAESAGFHEAEVGAAELVLGNALRNMLQDDATTDSND